MPYIGNQPGTGVRNRFIYTATASQTTFSGADNNGKTLKYADSDFVDVFLNGVCLVPVTDYTSTSKTSIVLVQAASLNDTLEVIAYDIATISDTVSKADGGTFEANVTFAAGADIITATAGTDNVRLGENAGDSIASGGNYNVTIGKDAGTALTTGDGNVAVGFEALKTEDANGKNLAIGYQALKTLDVGSDGFNTVIGYQAGTSMTTGIVNTLIGHQAGDALTTGNNNVAIGHEALGAEIQGDQNVAVGVGALQAQSNSSDVNALNTALGYNAGVAVTTGASNTIVGSNVGSSINTGYDNTFVGASAGASLTSGYSNTFIGKTAGQLMTGHTNTVIGRYDGNQDGQDNRTANGSIIISDGTGTIRTFINNDGYQRHKSVNAVFVGGNTHTFAHDNNDTIAFQLDQQHGSYASTCLTVNAHRVASTAYETFLSKSGNNSDIEFYVRGDGNVYADGSFSGGGADYAEYFEWADGNSDNQDRTGYTVVLDGEKIRLATSDDTAANVIGVVSANPSVVGDSDIQRWKGKYLLDDFGAYQMEEYTETWWIDENNVKHSYNTDKIPDDVTVPDDATVDTKDGKNNTFVRRKLNPDYNPDIAYLSRESRPEWATIGMMGKLRIRKGQPTGDRWIKMRDVSDSVEEWLVR